MWTVYGGFRGAARLPNEFYPNHVNLSSEVRFEIK